MEPCCDHCGNPGRGRVRSVKVAPLRAGVPDVGELILCRSCRHEPESAWRRRWREQPSGTFDDLARSHRTFADVRSTFADFNL